MAKKLSRRERVAARFAGVAETKPIVDGVVPLATGYFQVEAMRTQAQARRKDASRAKLKAVR